MGSVIVISLSVWMGLNAIFVVILLLVKASRRSCVEADLVRHPTLIRRLPSEPDRPIFIT